MGYRIGRSSSGVFLMASISLSAVALCAFCAWSVPKHRNILTRVKNNFIGYMIIVISAQVNYFFVKNNLKINF
jgi:hypothetical protein